MPSANILVDQLKHAYSPLSNFFIPPVLWYVCIIKMESNTDFFIIALFQLALNTKLFPTQGFVPFKRATCRYFNYVRGYSIPT